VRTIRFGVSRSHGGTQLVESTRRFAARLQERLGRPVTSIVARDYEHLREGVSTAGIDLAWMPPLLHARSDGLLAAVVERGGSVMFRAALLVRADSAFQRLADLKTARAAWSDRSSASGYLFPRLHLSQAGIEPAGESLFGSAASAMAAVIDGKADFSSCFVSHEAGGDLTRAQADVARSFPPAAWRLRVLDVTDAIPPDGLVLASGIEGTLQARLRDLLLGVHETPEGAAVLRDLFGADRLVPVTSQVSRAIERLRTLSQKHL
jgi:phosphonate transport system substrate-binding protein